MTSVDLLSDTTYCEQSVKQLDQLLGNSNKFPVKSAQIYGLRQIARQQPGKVEKFANHQRERAKSEQENDFWTLVSDLCGDSGLAWSVHKEGRAHLPAELQNVPERRQGMTHEEQRHRNELNRRQKEWLVKWTNEHIAVLYHSRLDSRLCGNDSYRQKRGCRLIPYSQFI